MCGWQNISVGCFRLNFAQINVLKSDGRVSCAESTWLSPLNDGVRPGEPDQQRKGNPRRHRRRRSNPLFPGNHFFKKYFSPPQHMFLFIPVLLMLYPDSSRTKCARFGFCFVLLLLLLSTHYTDVTVDDRRGRGPLAFRYIYAHGMDVFALFAGVRLLLKKKIRVKPPPFLLLL